MKLDKKTLDSIVEDLCTSFLTIPERYRPATIYLISIEDKTLLKKIKKGMNLYFSQEKKGYFVDIKSGEGRNLFPGSSYIINTKEYLNKSKWINI